jgi:multicomponent Na+:H+ antiporter subunit F
MSGHAFLEFAGNLSLALLTGGLILVTIRIARGPGLPDRILALDMLFTIGIGYIAVIAIKTGFMLYLDIAISLGLVGFLATIAFARFVLQRWRFGPGNGGDTNRSIPR